MSQKIHKRGRRVPLKPWMKNRLKRNKAQRCRCDALPFPHRRGSTFDMGRITVGCAG